MKNPDSVVARGWSYAHQPVDTTGPPAYRPAPQNRDL